MNALVTGGGGFLGSRICMLLAADGHRVTAASRRRYPELEAAGVESVVAELGDAEAIARVCAGRDVVFHVAARAGIWGPRAEFWSANVDGTRHVLAGCRKHGVSRLVYTSSPSVVFGTEDLCAIDEQQPMPARYLADYPETKAVAERLVLAANGPDFRTTALRPHLIWGPGDPHLIPRVIERARQGQLRQVGDGRNLVDIVYIDNAAEAHLLAATALSAGRAAGRAYFISQGEPVALWPWLNQILAAVGVPKIERRVSYRTARMAGAVFEIAYRFARIRSEPRMTRFLAAQLAKSHYFDISAARRDLGYVPRVSTAEGVEKLLEHLSGAQNSQPGAPLSTRG